jgi:hypothetical protein
MRDGQPSGTSHRVVLALVVGAAVSGIGALMLDEFAFTGPTPFTASVLLGLVVSELVVEIADTRSPMIGVATGVFVALALVWVLANALRGGAHPSVAMASLAIGLGGSIAGLRASGWPNASSTRDAAPG